MIAILQVKLNSIFMSDMADLCLLMICHRAVTITVTSTLLQQGCLDDFQSSEHPQHK